MQLNKTESSSWLAIILGVMTAATLIIQIVRSGGDITKTETALFGVLQFVFSLSFAWILSRASFRREFQEGQRRFAIAAYRRVREIERTTDRLLIRTSQRVNATSPGLTHEVDVIQQIATGIQDAVRSSIADWAEIIGEEITTVEKIEELRTKRARLLVKSESSQSETSNEAKESVIAQRLETLNQELAELKDSLPASLQVLDQSDDEDHLLEKTIDLLELELDSQNCLQLRCFWEPDQGFDKSINEVRVGEALVLSLDDVGPRVGIYVVRDSSAKSVGLLMNWPGTAPYYYFTEALGQVLGKSKFEAELLSIDDIDKPSSRIYFTVKAASISELVE